MTQYYIDADNGSDAADGLTAGSTDWLTLGKFTENARSAGDIATMRRGMTGQYDDGGDLEFSSDGDLGNPIIIEADYDDNWSDDVLTAGETYTTVFGSKTIAGSGALDAAIVAGAWVYVSTDNNRLHAYEVDSTSSNDVILKLAFRGTIGSGLALIVMPAPPKWQNAVTDAFRISLLTDHFWKFQGIEALGSQSSGVITADSSTGLELYDVVLKPDTGTTAGVASRADAVWVMSKCRFQGVSNAGNGIKTLNSDEPLNMVVSDCLFDDLATGVSPVTGGGTFIDCEFSSNNVDVDYPADSAGTIPTRFRNCKMDGTTEINANNDIAGLKALFEDFNGVPSVTQQYLGLSTTENTPMIQSDTGTVRSGGSNISNKVLPSTNIGSNYWTKLLLFEIAFSTSTASRKYEIFFKSNATANWTADPTAAELFIELEAWGHASNNFRKITKSTGVLDFNGVTTWNSLEVTVAPAQAGVAYLRGWYMKPKESAKTNEFFIDLLPVVT